MPGRAAKFLQGCEVCDPVGLPQRAVELAAALIADAEDLTRSGERREAARLARMMQDPAGKDFTTLLADRAFRATDQRLVAGTYARLVDRCGVPRFLAPLDRLLVSAARVAAPLLPGLVAPALAARLRADAGRVILPGEAGPLRRWLQRRAGNGVTLNVNKLGEAILGEEEADHRLADYVALLADPLIAFVSVKISSITSQISPAAFARTVAHLVERLRPLLAACRAHDAMLNLDMEEFRDLHLTLAALRTALAEPEHAQVRVGVAIQGYLPDSLPVLQELTAWAQQRVAQGGAPIKVRLVKGANLAMERVESALHGWHPAPFADKAQVDANYQRLLRWALRPEHTAAVRVGVASHNVFAIAYALLLRRHHGTEAQVELEMLEGMAPGMARAAAAAAGGLLLYAPAVPAADFRSAIAYLVRRLDENTAPGNYLAASFGMRAGSPAWREQERRFLVASRDADRHPEPPSPRRWQDRRHDDDTPAPAAFSNDAETDWCQDGNRRWLAAALRRRLDRDGEHVHLSIAGRDHAGAGWAEGSDPSRPGVVAYHHALAGPDEVESALTAARKAAIAVRTLGFDARRSLLLACAAALRHRRGELLAAAIVDGGKTAVEADPEICEAIDFASWYAGVFHDRGLHDGLGWAALGVVVVAPPWNFPISIPAGGILAALVAGNAVILKPAPEAVLCGRVLVDALHEACRACAVDPALVQFLPCRDEPEGRHLIRDSRVDAVVLTGATATARLFLSWRPDLHLIAETGGKNAMVITPAADREQAIRDLVQSAFGHAGQKCSACSLAILVGEVGTDPAFRRQLRDAAASLPVGGAHDPWHKVTPLIRPPGPVLARALTSLERGQEWVLRPRQDPENPRLWSPGIVGNVQPDQFLHATECFGPVLGLMRARDLDEAIRLQNHVAYGLTGGLHSLDEAEQRRWAAQVQVGNAYINRGITGAIVRRQPFGGWKASCFGPGAKAGGPHYALRLARARPLRPPRRGLTPPADWTGLLRRAAAELPGSESFLTAAARSFALARTHLLGRQPDHGVPGEVDLLRFRPLHELWARIDSDDPPEAAVLIALAARAVGARLRLSLDPEQRALRWLRSRLVLVAVESAAHLAERLPQGPDAWNTRLRWPRPRERVLLAAAHVAGLAIVRGAPTGNGRLELLAAVREQSLSHSYHRYGHTGLGSPFQQP